MKKMYKGISRRDFMKGTLAGAVGMTAAGLMTGCGGSSSSSSESASPAEAGAAGDAVYFGVISPNTGSLANYGISVTNGIKLALKEINEAGGVLGGKDIVISDYMDDKADAAEGANCFNKLVESGVSAIIGSVTSGVTQGLAELADECGMLLITPTGTADTITPGKKTVFRTCFKDSFQGEMVAAFAADKGIKKVAILYAAGDTYSAGLYDSFKGCADKYGLEIVDEESTSSTTDTDFTTQWTAIAATDAELVFAPYYYDAAGAYIVPQGRAAGYKGIIMGADGWDGVTNPDYMTGEVTDYNNCFFTNHYASDNPDEVVQNYVTAYKAEYDAIPSSLSALAYDTVYLLKECIEKAGSAETAKIVEAMTGASFTGVTGSFTMDEDNTPRKSVVVIEVKDGENVFYGTVEGK